MYRYIFWESNSDTLICFPLIGVKPERKEFAPGANSFLQELTSIEKGSRDERVISPELTFLSSSDTKTLLKTDMC